MSKRAVWINPLTGSDTVPTNNGELLTAAVAYWEDVLNEWRPKRPRKPADRAEKQKHVDTAIDRLKRYRSERDAMSWRPKNPNRLTLSLARDDLEAVQFAAKTTERAA